MKLKKQFDFIKNRRYIFAVSIALLLIGLIFNFIFGTDLDIQFKGGTMVSYTYNGTIDVNEADQVVQDAIGMAVNVQTSEDRMTESQKLVVNLANDTELTTDQMDAMNAALSQAFSDTGIEFLQANSVNPTMGQEFFQKSMVAVALAALLMILYIGIRFRKIGGLSAGIFAVLALLHDIALVYFTFIVLQIPLNDSFIAAVLTILGYSINGTIVVYDRIRENRRLMGPKAGIGEVVNLSINQSLSRTINTTISTVIAVGTVSVFAVIYNISSILSFSVPMLVGIIAGCYSSTCVTGPLWVMWKQFREKKLHKEAEAK